MSVAPGPAARGDLLITDLDIGLAPGTGPTPLEPVLNGVRATLSSNGFRTIMGMIVDEANRRAPVNFTLQRADLVPGGAEVVARVSKGPFGSDVRARVAITVVNGERLRAELVEIDAPKWVPVDNLLQMAATKTGPGIQIDPTNPRALLIEPTLLLAKSGVPGQLGPGAWAVDVRPQGLELSYA